MDARVRDLVRSVDPLDAYKLRVELLRRGELKNFQLGDIIELKEVESPWVRGVWRGKITKVFSTGAFTVLPVEEVDWRIKPQGNDLKAGVFVTKDDVADAKIIELATYDA